MLSLITTCYVQLYIINLSLNEFSSFLTVTHRSTESQRQPELSSIEIRESLNDADTRSEGSDDATQDE